VPNWNQVLDEIKNSNRTDSLDFVRRKYVKKLRDLTKRNVICYYSGWLQKRGIENANINDDDKNGLMAAIHGLDRSKGLDLILHTPGGELTATESIVFYLKQMFKTNIRAFVPQIAMSAGTMIACSCKEIIMGKQSNLGPIDPQFSGIPAYGVISEFDRALEEIKKDPATIPIWQTIVSKYHPTFLGECQNAIELSSEMVTKWLETGMFSGDSEAHKKAKSIVKHLSNHDNTKTHSRHIHFAEALEFGLKIKSLEEDQNLQDTVLTIHHAFMHTFANSPAIKIIENHLGKAVVYMFNPQK